MPGERVGAEFFAEASRVAKIAERSLKRGLYARPERCATHCWRAYSRAGRGIERQATIPRANWRRSWPPIAPGSTRKSPQGGAQDCRSEKRGRWHQNRLKCQAPPRPRAATAAMQPCVLLPHADPRTPNPACTHTHTRCVRANHPAACADGGRACAADCR